MSSKPKTLKELKAEQLRLDRLATHRIWAVVRTHPGHANVLPRKEVNGRAWRKVKQQSGTKEDDDNVAARRPVTVDTAVNAAVNTDTPDTAVNNILARGDLVPILERCMHSCLYVT